MNNFLTVAELVNKYIAGCEGKVKSSNFTVFCKAILAGAMIAFGAAGSNVASHSATAMGTAKVMAGCVFPVGLMMVILLGAELFTGDCLMVMGNAAKQHKVIDTVRVLTVVFIGNFVGGILIALAVYGSKQLDMSSGLLGAYTIKVALGKANISFGTGVVSGILCNILVSGAVLMATASTDVTGKLFASFFTIMLFVVSGYEHCVANMYFIGAGLVAKGNQAYVDKAIEVYGYTAGQLESLNWQNFLVTNLIPVTIGNIIGGGLLGLMLYYLNCKKKNA